ncbi:MAG: transaldolase, partial [Chloroflexota bacterium]|nr:transaldolase [Chloroflexota bacterium]
YDKVCQVQSANPGEHFIAITDPGTPLEQLAQEHTFRHIFLNPSDIGGRYSALSFFGLVPAALLGVDIELLLVRAQIMMAACGQDTNNTTSANYGLELGTILGTLGNEGHNKITFVISPEMSSFGLWVEQLIAESTGKEERGLLPVEGEKLGDPSVYGNDRLFVYLRLEGGDNADLDKGIEALQKADQPIVRIDLDDKYDFGGQFFLWEFATAVAGIFLGINPFDEPNVQESKDNTNRILEQYEKEGKLPEPSPVVTLGSVDLQSKQKHAQINAQTGNVSIDMPQIQVFGPDNGSTSLEDYLKKLLAQANPGDYIALMAYVQITDENEAALQDLRTALRDTYRVATTVGYGPRFLHSTGQLHKGGANNGVFIQITGDTHYDAAIPGEPYTFDVLKAAQALGDLRSLDSHGRPNVRIAISGNLAQGLHIIEHDLELYNP